MHYYYHRNRTFRVTVSLFSVDLSVPMIGPSSITPILISLNHSRKSLQTSRGTSARNLRITIRNSLGSMSLEPYK